MTLEHTMPREGRRITSPAAATWLIGEIHQTMDNLLALFAEETALVRAGKLLAAGKLANAKAEQSALYTRLMLIVRDEIHALYAYHPDATDVLRRRHELFRAEVEANLSVLSTAREVAEDLLRALAADLEPLAGAPLYGQAGQAATSGSGMHQGMTLNRKF